MASICSFPVAILKYNHSELADLIRGDIVQMNCYRTDKGLQRSKRSVRQSELSVEFGQFEDVDRLLRDRE
jgi:hypothetical protein